MDTFFQDVVVTGMGVISSIGKNIDEFKVSLKEGISNFNNKADTTGIEVGAYIEDFDFNLEIDKLKDYLGEEIKDKLKYLRRVEFPQKATVIAALQAYISANLIEANISPERVGIIVSGNNISQGYQDSIREKFKDKIEYTLPSYALSYSDFNYVGVLSEILEIKGEGFTVGGNSASANVAIIKALQSIQLGIIDACLVVGPVTEFSKYEINALKNLNAMGGKLFKDDPENACRPFDKKHEGFIPGQGAACVVMESLESAKKRKAKLLAQVMSGAIVLDGNRLSNPSVEGEVRAMNEALKRARLEANKIDYINAHGTSTPMGDDIELEAIKNVFNSSTSDIFINSSKSLTGHCLNSAAIIELIASIIQMNEGFVHINKNLEQPNKLGYNYVIEESKNAEIKYALSNAFGFGGINTSIILKRMGD